MTEDTDNTNVLDIFVPGNGFTKEEIDAQREALANDKQFQEYKRQEEREKEIKKANKDYADKKISFSEFQEIVLRDTEYKTLVEKYAKEAGFKNKYEKDTKKAQAEGFKNLKEKLNKNAQDLGFKSLFDKLNKMAIEEGFRGCSDKYSHVHKRILMNLLSNHEELKCKGCGENHIEFLTIDHINNDGAEHRKELDDHSGSYKKVLDDIEKGKYPLSNLQILCWNCQWKKEKLRIRIARTDNRFHSHKKYHKMIISLLSANQIPHCACPNCKENDINVLTIHHVNNDGAEHRRRLPKGWRKYKNMYEEIISGVYPLSNYALLCYNCNEAIEHYGYCPHGDSSNLSETNHKYDIIPESSSLLDIFQ